MEFVYEESVTRADAVQAYANLWKPEPRVETVSLDRAFGRVLAEDLTVKYSIPVVRSSRMDGVAVRSADFAAGMPDTSSWEYGRDYVRADTGDDFPDEFDAVIAVEQAEFVEGGTVRFSVDPAEVVPGYGVSPCGSLAKAGTPIVPAHTRLTPEVVASAAVGGYAQVKVFAAPRVAFIPTGTELVPWGSFPKRGQNLEANSLLVRGMLEQWGAEAVVYPITSDDRDSIAKALDRALEAADIVIVNAGSSRGSEDFNSQLMQERGTFFKHGVRCVPGRPVGMSLIDGRPVVNVPGPVGAAWLCMDWLIRALVAQWFGEPVYEQPTVKARLAEDVKFPRPMERVSRMALSDDGEGGFVASALPRSAGVPQTIACTDALFTLPLEETCVEAGTVVDVELLRPVEVVRASWAR